MDRSLVEPLLHFDPPTNGLGAPPRCNHLLAQNLRKGDENTVHTPVQYKYGTLYVS